MRIVEVISLADKQWHLPLLLEADPSEDLVMQYLPRGQMFALEQHIPMVGARPNSHRADVLGEVVVVELGDGRCELKNLAIAPHARGCGLGRLLLEHVAALYSEQCSTMLVGTSEFGAPFYERCGFVFSHKAPGFFAKNYPVPIFKDGKQCVDMLYLRRSLYAMQRMRA